MQAFFAKYDAAALYLSRRKYPPGLTYVEKNTFRRFCKKFLIKGLQKSHCDTFQFFTEEMRRAELNHRDWLKTHSASCLSDDELHIMIKDQVLLVLRSRQQVEEALVNYHNELNHLDVNKCLRLLNERSGLKKSPETESHQCPQSCKRHLKQWKIKMSPIFLTDTSGKP